MFTIGLWVIRCRYSVFDTHVCEDRFGHGITELCSAIRNDNIRTTISRKQQIEFFCYGCRFFVTDWNHFWPFGEEITYGKNVLVTLRFYHGYQINTYLAENLLWNWNTFHCHLSFLELNVFFPLAPVTRSNELFDVFCHPLPIITPSHFLSGFIHTRVSTSRFRFKGAIWTRVHMSNFSLLLFLVRNYFHPCFCKENIFVSNLITLLSKYRRHYSLICFLKVIYRHLDNTYLF